MMKETLKKKEILRSKLQIEMVFNNGVIIKKYPLLLKYTQSDKDSDVQAKVLISVPKRSFSKAVDRNKIKRLIKEAYRRNKIILYDWLNINEKQLLIALIYTGKTIPDYKEVEKKLILILQTLIKSDGKNNW